MKSKIFTIPNVISLIRIILIPIFIIAYLRSNTASDYSIPIGILFLSGISDIIDGFIARRFNMISDVGKVLDPIADKLTQAVITFCLMINHRYLIPMFGVLFIKELLTLFVAVNILKSGTKPISSKWFGKLSTVMIYINMAYALLSDIISSKISLPHIIEPILVCLSIICMIISMFGYIKLILNNTLSENSSQNGEN